jgi:lysozyme family protein
VLRDEFWGAACDALPPGLDLMLFNGRMMSGGFPAIFQQCLGLVGDDVDDDFGRESLAAVAGRHAPTLIQALYGNHYAYLKRLSSWPEFKGGWTKRLNAVLPAALALAA